MRRNLTKLPTGFLALFLVIAVLLSGCGDVVRLPDCGDCRPVEMSVDQTFELELGSDRTVGNDPEAYEWELVDAGTLNLVSQDKIRRSEDPTEFRGGYSYSWVFTLEPTTPGTTRVSLLQRAAGDPGGDPLNVAEFTVIISG
jgi:predicted secreted protein